MADAISDAQLVAWAQALEGYARDWDETFENRPNYFTQEFWYLLVGCLIADWRGKPITVGAACQIMKSGSNRTREERIKRAADDGYLTKERAGEDGRAAVVRPTPKLERLMRGHFERTLSQVRAALAE
ncbi:hypothetical protein [Caulobacter sp. 17J65-9]|uniref:hypothetical protein n=1 Tax=Caulobacter sp. 17J65-9 TaxID=2709382 RepID=UPI0013C9C0BD|nr:hypothetical protein [Caulobacter sp. 17J65-9]NEX94786.1 hypothetical protein [Caulobacter sp. 17J65-9]